MNSSNEMNGGAVKIEGLDDLRSQSGPSLEGYIHAVWIPTLKDFPVCGLRLMVSDPLANQANLTAKVLDILLEKKRAYRIRDILDALKAEGIGKELQPLKKGVYRALQTLRSRGDVICGAKFWTATAHIEGGRPCSP